MNESPSPAAAREEKKNMRDLHHPAQKQKASPCMAQKQKPPPAKEKILKTILHEKIFSLERRPFNVLPRIEM